VRVLALRSGVLRVSFPMAAAAVTANEDAKMASVTALSRKAALLSRSGHFARAAEKCAAAVAAAQSLQQPDCLIVTSLQSEEVSMLRAHAVTRGAGTSLADAAKAYERIYCVLLPAIMAVLQRRKAAGTLLLGACRAHEAAFFGELQQYKAVIAGETPFKPAVLADMGALVGYETCFFAASVGVSWLLLPQLWGDELRAMQLPTLADGQLAAQHAFVLSALELVLQPLVLSTVVRTAGEAGLVEKCRMVVSSPAVMRALPAGWAAQLRDALQRVERSGAVQQRGMERSIEMLRQGRAEQCAAAAAAAAARGLRTCALSSCGAREAHVSHFKLCSACKTVAYYSREHQAEDWPAHKLACKASRKAAAAAASQDGGGASGA
jgi:hypothetical protein